MGINIFQLGHICGLFVLLIITIDLLFFNHLLFLFEYKTGDSNKATKMKIALGVMTLIVFMLGLINVISKWSQIQSWRITF